MSKKEFVLITGGSAGIGFEIAKLYQNEGHPLIIASSNIKNLERAHQELLVRNPKSKIHIVQSDLASLNGAEDLFKACETQHLAVDILVNNAGIGLYGEHVKIKTEKMKSMLVLNVIALTTLCELFGNKMKEKGQGAILNVASTASYQPLPYLAAYAASKSYVLNFSQSFAEEMAPYGVQVTCVCPGSTETNFFTVAGLTGSEAGDIASKVMMTPEDVAEYSIRLMRSGRRTGIPGLTNKVVAYANQFIPNRIITTFAHRMLKH